jgi:hypothetical protein
VIIREHVKTAHDFNIGVVLWYRRRVSQYAFARVGILRPLQRSAEERIKLYRKAISKVYPELR